MTLHYLVICHLAVLVILKIDNIDKIDTDNIDNTIKFAKNCHLGKIKLLYTISHQSIQACKLVKKGGNLLTYLNTSASIYLSRLKVSVLC